MSLRELVLEQIEFYSNEKLANLAEVHEGCVSFKVEWTKFNKYHREVIIDRIKFKVLLNEVAKKILEERDKEEY